MTDLYPALSALMQEKKLPEQPVIYFKKNKYSHGKNKRRMTKDT